MYSDIDPQISTSIGISLSQKLKLDEAAKNKGFKSRSELLRKIVCDFLEKEETDFENEAENAENN